MGGKGSGAKPRDAASKAAVMALLAAGIAAPCELVGLTGLERSSVYQWSREVDWRKVREKRLLKAFNRARLHGQKLGQG
jgi:hypothetical protein